MVTAGEPALPRYVLEDAAPVRLPPGRHFGALTGVQVSPDGHIWVLHIASQMQWGPPGSLDDPAARLPAVCEFDADGNFLQGWGGPDWLPRENGLQQWPKQEETIAFDDEDTIWVFGANVSYDHAVQRFSRDGRLLLRLGRFGETGGNDSPDLLGCPTDCWHDVERREVYVTDGYVNHRVAVFDSATGAFKRVFGAYGRKPDAALPVPERFHNPVHAILRGPDGLLYVSDRKADRVQVFDAVGREDARFVRELVLEGVASPFGTCFNLAFTPCGQFMLFNDGSNSRLWIVDVQQWKLVGQVAVAGVQPGDLTGTCHKIATDKAGNVLVARTAVGLQRLHFEGV